MARKVNHAQRNTKRDMILDNARDIFCANGFLTVTMQQIAEACGISRGGLYLFFPSVEDVFEAVISNRNQRRSEEIRSQIEQNAEFFTLLNLYFASQKKRLLSMENSILMATYEYYSVNQSPEGVRFRLEQVATFTKTIVDLLKLGVRQGAILNTNIEEVAQSYVYTIEGMSVFGMFNNLSAREVDVQIEQMKKLLEIPSKKE